jgi:hypothetical protein
MSLKWSPPIGWTVASIVATCGAALIYLAGRQLLDKGTSAWLTAFACLIAVITLIATIVVSDEKAIKRRDWRALVQFRPMSMLFLAFVAASGIISTIGSLVEPQSTATPPARIVQRIQGLWGQRNCTVTFRFSIREDALIIDAVRRPSGSPPYRLEATIMRRQGDVLDVLGERPHWARGMGARFTYFTNGVTERLTWDDQVDSLPSKLDRC